MDSATVVEVILKSVFVLLFMTGGFAYTTFLERKVLARMQVRVGPNRAGPLGLLQPIADGVKLIFKEELIPENADKFLFILAPILTVIPALIITAVVPWGTKADFFGRMIDLGIAGNVNVGVLYIMTVTSISVYGITLAGWASNNKYAMLGGLRSTAQMISYELALGMAFIGPVLLSGSLGMNDIVVAQIKSVPYMLLQPVGAIIFLIATTAEINRAPFDMPEAEQELTAGYHTEYSGMKFALFFMAEYIKMIAVCMIGATLFLGGYWGPLVDRFTWLGPLYLLAKVFILLFGLIWIRATLPRIRYDRLMAFGWKVLFPLSLATVAATAVVIVLAPNALWIIPIATILLAFAVLLLVPKPRVARRSANEDDSLMVVG